MAIKNDLAQDFDVEVHEHFGGGIDGEIGGPVEPIHFPIVA